MAEARGVTTTIMRGGGAEEGVSPSQLSEYSLLAVIIATVGVNDNVYCFGEKVSSSPP